ncbi:MAG: [FeFe] hydrogenase H-cluster radical SAM maturase HydE [Filifactor alocis]|nr:[FeFe] hydrogenase H-cluster radical SAM maturase HydE [Filifactor alocis]
MNKYRFFEERFKEATPQTLASLLEREDFSSVYAYADNINRKIHGDIVDIRAIIEFSNHCRRRCAYCGLNSTNTKVRRYRMSPEEIVETALLAWKAGYKTVVLQSGEDLYYTKEIIAEIVTSIKARSGIKITLSCGERSREELSYWRRCGVDRYLLKHETSDPSLYAELHSCGTLEERLSCLRTIKNLGYETGSGFMIGLPNQTAETIAQDILLLKDLDCDMAGIGPFIPHPETSLREADPGSTELTKRAVALTRLLLPHANLPATTSLGVLDSDEKRSVFDCGANVIMRKVTPSKYVRLYEIYPGDIKVLDVYEERRELEHMITSLGKMPR